MNGEENCVELVFKDVRAVANSSTIVADKNLLKELVEAIPSLPSKRDPNIDCRD